MNPHRRLVALALLLALWPIAALRAQTVAGAPSTIDYQGKALDAAGNVLAPTTPANYEMRFRIYDAQEGGNAVWSEIQIVTVSKGLFSVRLGEGAANGTEPRPMLSDSFNGSERFLGVTIIISGQTPVEILPRLAFLATPFAYVANRAQSAERLILNPSTNAAASSVNLAQVSYATQTFTSSTALTETIHTAVVDAAAAAATITLPGVTTRREYYIAKKDSTVNIVTVTAPSGGTINGSTASLKLKVLGESVAIQNTGGNEWWVVSDSRDKTPVGTIIASAQNSATPPPGYLFCNGTSYSRTGAQSVDLFAAIGTVWGAPDASNFRVPDLRGLFLRGVDGGRGMDPDRNSRQASSAGGSAGDAVGSYQADAYGTHSHTFSATDQRTGNAGSHNHGSSNPGGLVGQGQYGLPRIATAAYGHVTATGFDATAGEIDIRTTLAGIPNDGEHSHTFSISGTTGTSGSGESRSKNAAVNYFIKY